ncbi:unnamed protein product [Kuraishia capsulata CBS 1993]|uniref:Mmc1 C-terminal domain-containing protein n=1 Tax=Kuraishia capsulata CBS 1993 TaxID=1382522 RepID=W6MJX6_9ASCO|nr:uncharacterized protein KUCA_T00000814001 [Kuraishia capsulata CBS 1993]CDK24847.1 unnamed protein product [Kuraishia capsulata CBS 1993]
MVFPGICSIARFAKVHPVARTVSFRCASSSTLESQLELAKQCFTSSSITEKIEVLQSSLPPKSGHSNSVRIGIVAAKPEIRNKLTNVLLCDPLDFEGWYTEFSKRPTDTANVVKFGTGLESQDVGNARFYNVPSPFLSAELRPAYHGKIGESGSSESGDPGMNKEFFNNLEVLEVSDLKLEEPGIVKGVSEIQLSESLKATRPFLGCNIYIFVKSQFSDSPDPKFSSWPMIQVLDTPEVNEYLATPISDLVVDLDATETANELLMTSTSNSSQFLSLTKKSNINSLLYEINKQTSGKKPIVSLLKCLVHEMYSELSSEHEGHNGKASSELYMARQNAQLTDKEARFSTEIHDWAQRSHLELQSEIIPFLDNQFVYTFGKIPQILLNVDEFDLVLSRALFGTSKSQNSGWFSRSVSGNGFLSASQARFDYILGKIDGLPSDISEDHYVTSVKSYLPETSAIESVKTAATNEKLVMLQKLVNKSIISNLGLVNLPVFFVVSLLHLYGHIDLNTGGALFVLSLGLTLNNISKDTGKLLEGFKVWYVEELRKSIDQSKVLLMSALADKISGTKKRLLKKFKVISDIEKGIEGLEQ